MKMFTGVLYLVLLCIIRVNSGFITKPNISTSEDVPQESGIATAYEKDANNGLPFISKNITHTGPIRDMKIEPIKPEKGSSSQQIRKSGKNHGQKETEDNKETIFFPGNTNAEPEKNEKHRQAISADTQEGTALENHHRRVIGDDNKPKETNLEHTISTKTSITRPAPVREEKHTTTRLPSTESTTSISPGKVNKTDVDIRLRFIDVPCTVTDDGGTCKEKF